jgi:hypothetical protein
MWADAGATWAIRDLAKYDAAIKRNAAKRADSNACYVDGGRA